MNPARAAGERMRAAGPPPPRPPTETQMMFVQAPGAPAVTRDLAPATAAGGDSFPVAFFAGLTLRRGF